MLFNFVEAWHFSLFVGHGKGWNFCLVLLYLTTNTNSFRTPVFIHEPSRLTDAILFHLWGKNDLKTVWNHLNFIKSNKLGQPLKVEFFTPVFFLSKITYKSINQLTLNSDRSPNETPEQEPILCTSQMISWINEYWVRHFPKRDLSFIGL